MQDLILGLDIGTSSLKALLCDAGGKVITQAEAPNHLLSPHIGWAEQAAENWQQNTVQVIRKCLTHAQTGGSRIVAVGVSGMVPALVILDQDGKPLRPVIQYNDARAGEEIFRLENEHGGDSFYKITGARLSAQSIGPKWLWLKQHEPQICKTAAAICGSYDFLNYFLTGDLNVERNWALEGGLYDLRTGAWSQTLCSLFQIPAQLLPVILKPTDITGRIRTEIARETGLLQGTPVVAGSADHVAAALAAGIIQNGDVLIKFGSSGDILYCSDECIIDTRLYIDYHNIPGKYLPNGCMATSGSLLKWFVSNFYDNEAGQAENKGRSLFAELDQEAEKLPAGSNGVVVLPYFLGAKTPISDPQARGVFWGLTLSHNRMHMYRAVLEAVAYGFRDHFEVLRDLGLPIRRVIASEGGARSRLWRQISADVLNMKVNYLQNNPGSAYGAAIVAGMGIGLMNSWDIVENDIEWGDLSTPTEKNLPIYDGYYRVYQQLYSQLKKIQNS